MEDNDQGQPWDNDPVVQSYPDPQQGGTWDVTPHPEERYDDIHFRQSEPWANDPVVQSSSSNNEPWANDPIVKGEEPPSAVGTAVRGVLRGAIPTTAGVLGGFAGAAVGGAAGSAVPGPGTVVGGIAGGLAGGFAASEAARGVQEKVADTLGIDSPESREADAAAHPYINQAAELAPSVASLGTAGKLGARVAVGGIMGGIDLLNQGFHKGFSNIDPTEAAIAAGFGAAAPTPRAWTNKITGPVEAGAAKFFGRTPQAEGAPVIPPAGELTQQGLNVETPDVGVGQAPTADRLDTQFPKTSGITEVDNIHMTPDIAAAMAEHPPAAGSNVNETPPSVERTLSPEEIASRQADLIATPARPMVGKSGRPFAPQADNLRVGEEPPPVNDVTSGPGRFSDGDSVATAPDATAPPSAGTESSPTISESENFGGRGVDGQNENTRNLGPLLSPTEEALIETSRAQRGAAQNAREKAARGQEGEAFLPETPKAALMRSREERLASAERGPIQPKIGEGEPPLAMSRKTPSKGPEDILKQIDDAAKSFAEETGQEYKEQPPGAKAFANADTPPGGAPRDLRAKIENAIKETGFAKMWNHFLNVRGMYSPTAEAASGVIRKTGTDLAKGANQALQALKPYQNLINALPAEARAKVAEDIQSGKSEWAPELKPVVDAISKLRKQAEQKLEAAKIPAKFELNSELGPRFSRAEAKGKKAQKSILSMEDFNEQHPERPNPDPIAATLDRVHEIDKFIAKNEVLKFADERGYLAREPQPGWTKLDVPTQNLYAPEDFARQYNNAVSQGIHGMSEKAGDLYDGWRRSTNFVTQVSLAGPLFHGITMIRGAFDSKMAQAITHFAAGDFATGLKRFAEIPLSPYTFAFNKGTKGLQDVWNNKPASAEDVALSKILDEAGHRPVGYQHALDLETSGLGSLFDAFKEGRLSREMGEAGQRIKGAGNILQQGKQTGAEAFRILGRAMSTIQQPLFQHYIPALKTGVIREKLVDWLAANETASHEEVVRAARRIVDNVDAVFGEMIQDNIMWNKTAKQTAMGMMRSYSWFLGTAESLVGGSKTLLTHPERLRMSDVNHDPNAAFVLGMAAMGIITNSIYQYLKTGKPPQEPMDLAAGRTGGKLPGGRPERAIFPGYEKDVFGWLHDPVAEAKGKIATLPMDIWETITNQGWHTDKDGRPKYGPIANENAPFLTRLGQYAHHIGESVIPIQAQTFTRKPKPGSAISSAEQYANIRPAPSYLSGPNPKQQQAVAREWKRTHPGER